MNVFFLNKVLYILLQQNDDMLKSFLLGFAKVWAF